MDEPPWPTGTTDAERVEVVKGRVAWLNARASEIGARVQSEVDADLELHKAYHDALIEGGRSGIDRSRTAADTVQKASAAILAIYTGILGLAFSAADAALPSRGVIPAIFLGLAVTFSTAYVAYLSKPESVAGPSPQSAPRLAASERTKAFLEWAAGPVTRRAYWLRASVVALGVALMFLPAPFLTGSLPYVDRLPWNESAKAAEPAAEKPPWPVVPGGVTGPRLQLWRIRYAAEVKEAAEDRAEFKQPGQPSYANQTWWLLAIFGGVAVATVPLVGRR